MTQATIKAMKQKTKKRLRAVLRPFVFIWGSIAVIIGLTGVLLESLSYVMLGDTRTAKRTIKAQFSR